jgi:excisionase family DNA binding protein
MTVDNVDGLPCNVGEVGKGRLSCVLKAACAGLNDVTVLSLQRDPYQRDTEASQRDGRWFAAPVARFVRAWKTIHWSGLHYAVVSAGDLVKPDGTPYCNDDKDWEWFQEAAQYAQWLGYLPFARIADAKNVEPIVWPLFAGSPTPPFVWVHASGAHSLRAGRGWQSTSCAGRNGGRNRRTWSTEKGKRGKTRRDPNRPLQTADVSTKPAVAPTAQGGPKDEPPNLKSAVAGGESQRSSRTLRRPVPQFYTVDEIAKRLNLSRRSVSRLIQSRELAAHRFGRSLRVSDDDLAEFLARNRSK